MLNIKFILLSLSGALFAHVSLSGLDFNSTSSGAIERYNHFISPQNNSNSSARKPPTQGGSSSQSNKNSHPSKMDNHSSRVMLKGSFIYWRQGFLQIPFAGLSKTFLDNREEAKIRNFDFPYAPGFKIGAGYQLPHNGWDLFLNWTQLHSHPSGSAKAKNGFDVVNLFNGDIKLLANKATARGNITLNVCDFDLGKSFYSTRSRMLHFFTGLKAAWLHCSFHSKFQDAIKEESQEPVFNLVDSIKEHSSGIGPRLGFNTRWYLGNRYLSICIDGAGSMLFENFKTYFSSTYEDDEAHGGIIKSKTKGVSPVIELYVGLNYGNQLSKTRIDLSLGYEAQYWFDQIPNFPIISGLDSSFNLQGLTATLKLSF
ncbi:MAG: hypothetical protein HYZ48_03245 [Chlamydiales bacterium]|nr:hypothetical protein [Chlamydiales bacterium]